jgi:hypothetical protein
MHGCLIIRRAVVVAVLASVAGVGSPPSAWATGAEPAKDIQVDPAPCLAAARANEDDRTIELCGAVIDDEKTARPDRVKALTGRGAALKRDGIRFDNLNF